MVARDDRSVVEQRTFLNTDVPDIVNLWNEVPEVGGDRRITADLLETHVFSRNYFDPAGMLVAVDPNRHRRLCGIAHCSFAPAANGVTLDEQSGVLCWVRANRDAPPETTEQLLQWSIDFFRGRKSRTVHYGSRFPQSPFYAGLLRGSYVAGVRDSETGLLQQLNQLGFQREQPIDVFRIDVSAFRPPVDRRVVMAKRQYDIRVSIDPLPSTWWESSQSVFRQKLDYRLIERRSNREKGFLSFWNTVATDSGWDSAYFGLGYIEINSEVHRLGLGKTLVVEAIKELTKRGVIEVEAQVPRTNAACQELLKRVGFELDYTGIQMCRTLD